LSINAPGVLTNDSDLDGDGLTVTVAANPSNGNLTLSANGSFVYTPNAGFSGSDSFSYTVSDGHGGTATATVHSTVGAVNDPPVAIADGTAFVEGDDYVLDAVGNDLDSDGDTLVVIDVTQPAEGLVSFEGGSIRFTPADPNFVGIVTFSYTVSDGNGGTDT